MLKCLNVYKKEVLRHFSKSSRSKIDEFLKSKKLEQRTSETPKYLKPDSDHHHRHKKLSKDLLSSFKPINMNKLSSEEAMMSPLFEYRNKKNINETTHLQYDNAVKLKSLDNERKKYILTLADERKVDMYIFFKGREQYNRWIKHIGDIKKIDPQVGALQMKILETYHFDPLDEYHDSKLLYEYTGTPKGPRPEDDPVYFADWYRKNLSNSAFKFLSTVENINEVEITTKHDEVIRGFADYSAFLNSSGIQCPSLIANDLENEDFIKGHAKTLNQIAENKDTELEIDDYDDDPLSEAADRSLEDLEENEDPSETVEYIIDQPSNVADYLDLPFSQIAAESPMQFYDFMEYQSNWNIMIQCLQMANIVNNVDRMVEDLQHTKDYKERDTTYYESVWGYYEHLPQKLKDLPLVKATVLAVEKRGYFLTLEDKQEILNRACIITSKIAEGKLKRGYYAG